MPAPKAVPEPIPVMRALRDQALAVQPDQLGVSPTAERPRVWGGLMEMGQADALITLVALGDGTASLYFGSGGGVIGAGQHEEVRRAAEGFLAEVERHHLELEPTTECPLPHVGRVRFYARTFEGTRTAEAGEGSLRTGEHALSPLFFSAHRVIAAIRERTEARTSGPRSTA